MCITILTLNGKLFAGKTAKNQDVVKCRATNINLRIYEAYL